MNPVDESGIDYEKDKRIDLNNLHEEWFRQPKLCGDYNKLVAQAEKQKEKAKEYLDICKVDVASARARLDLSIRKEPNKYDPPAKISESWVESAILIQSKINPDCIKAATKLSEAQNELIEVNYKLNVYNAAVKMITDRKAALQNAVDLWSRGYFSVPNLPRPNIEEFRNVQETKRDDVVDEARQQLNMRRRK